LDELDCTRNPIKTICVSNVATAIGKKGWLKDPTAEYKVCQ